MTKRIKITDPKDLREGMRVEVVSEKLGVVQGVLYKPSDNPLREILCLTYKGKVGIHKAMIRGDYGDLIDEEMIIHRLIDGIEDVVVGDQLYQGFDPHSGVLERLPNAIFITDAWGRYEKWVSLGEAQKMDLHIYVPEQDEKIELTDVEGKEDIKEYEYAINDFENIDVTNYKASIPMLDEVLHRLEKLEQKGVEPEDIIIKNDG